MWQDTLGERTAAGAEQHTRREFTDEFERDAVELIRMSGKSVDAHTIAGTEGPPVTRDVAGRMLNNGLHAPRVAASGSPGW